MFPSLSIFWPVLLANSLKLLGERIAQSDILLRYFANHAISSFLSSRNSQWSVLLTNVFIFFNDTSQQVCLPFLSTALKVVSVMFQLFLCSHWPCVADVGLFPKSLCSISLVLVKQIVRNHQNLSQIIQIMPNFSNFLKIIQFTPCILVPFVLQSPLGLCFWLLYFFKFFW